MMTRRQWFGWMGAGVGAAALWMFAEDADAGPRRRHRRRVRRRIRRRIRRRVVRRVVFGRPFWVVPVGIAVGWELMDNDRVVVVKETKIVEKETQKVEVLVVVDSSGNTEEIEVVREDNAENGAELEGSTLEDGDNSPSIEVEVEVEVED